MGVQFWSSSGYEGSSHVTHMHAVSLLIHPNFPSNSTITWSNSTFGPPFGPYCSLFCPVWTNEGGWKARRHAYGSHDYLFHILNWTNNRFPGVIVLEEHPSKEFGEIMKEIQFGNTFPFSIIYPIFLSYLWSCDRSTHWIETQFWCI